LIRHKKNVHSNAEDEKCSECSKIFDSIILLTEHKKINHPPLICDNCEKVYSSRAGLRLHKLKHSSEIKYRCPVCDKVFYQKHAFDGHMNKHCNSRPFKCTVCKASFCYETALRKHIKALHTASKYSCEHCGHEFSQKCNLRDHINAKHVFDYVNRCNGCGKTFKYRSGLSRHRKIFNH